jgi:hypothetical protein
VLTLAKKHTMKQYIIIFIFFLFSKSIFSQILLETSHISTGNMTHEDFGITYLDSTTCVYYYVDYENEMIVLYHLDHSIMQIINIPVYYTANPTNYRIFYISKSLFDCDASNIEYLLNFNNSSAINPVRYVKILRQDESVMFYADSANIQISLGASTIITPGIFKTPDGTKMILKKNNVSWDTYSLCGNLPLFVQHTNEILTSKAAFPNPANNQIYLPYELPKGVNNGTIKIYNITGQLLNAFEIDKNFSNLIFNVSDLSAGQYFYEVSSAQGIHASQKFVKQ